MRAARIQWAECTEGREQGDPIPVLLPSWGWYSLGGPLLAGKGGLCGIQSETPYYNSVYWRNTQIRSQPTPLPKFNTFVPPS